MRLFSTILSITSILFLLINTIKLSDQYLKNLVGNNEIVKRDLVLSKIKKLININYLKPNLLKNNGKINNYSKRQSLKIHNIYSKKLMPVHSEIRMNNYE